MLKDLQFSFGLTYLFISHDLSVVCHISDRVGVMYLERLVELVGNHLLYENPLRPYTQAPLSAVPHHNPLVKRERLLLTGNVPTPANPPTGCTFHTRAMPAWRLQDEDATIESDIGRTTGRVPSLFRRTFS